MGLAGRKSIHGWPWSGGLRLACSRTPTGASTSRRRRKALKDYVDNGRKATPIWNNVKTSLRGIIPSLGRLRLGGLRHRALLRRHRKVFHLHLLLPTRRILTSIQIPPLLLLLPLKYGRPTLLPNVCHHKLVGNNNRGLAKIMAWRLLEGIRENPWPPNNSHPKEVITACQYPCITAVQRPSFYEPGMVTAMMCLLQNLKALGHRKCRTEVVDSKMAVKSSGMSWSNPNYLLTLLAK